MAKVAKPAKRELSVHSRAARRGLESSGSNNGKAAVEQSDYKPWLHSAHDAGISKKRTKQVTRQQRARQQRGLEKAEVVLDKLDKKVADSKQRGKKVDARRADWEELNEKLAGKPGKVKKAEVIRDSTVEALKTMDNVVEAPVAMDTTLQENRDAPSIPVSTSTLQPVTSEPAVMEAVDEIT